MRGVPAWLSCAPASTLHPASPTLRSGSATFSHKGEKGTRAFPRSQISDGDPKAGHNGRLFVSFNVSSTMAVFTCCTDSCGSSTPLTNSASDFRSGVTTFRI